MKAEEIRIGNWVKYGNVSAPVIIPEYIGQVKAITLFGELDFSTTQTENIVPAKHCMGVELTPQILVMAGFENSGTYWFLDDVRIDELGMIDPMYVYRYNYAERKIRYVHELMNLYHALTGTELQINLHTKKWVTIYQLGQG